MYIKRNIELRSFNHCCSESGVNTTYSECVSVALVIKHAVRMRCIILSSVDCPPVPYYSFHKQHNFNIYIYIYIYSFISIQP